MSRWFRMYDDVLDDPKVQRLPADLFKAWVNLLCLASKNGGTLPCIDDVAFALRMDVECADDVVGSLVERGLLDEEGEDAYRPHNWNSRQFKSDQDPTAAERQRRKREREKAVTRDVTDESRRPDTDTDTEKIVVVSSARARDLDSELREAAGWKSHPNPNLFVTGPISALIDAGADLDLDVIPTIRALAPKCTSPNWKFFLGAIARARDDRIAAAKIVSHPAAVGASHAASRHKPTRTDTLTAIRARIDATERRATADGDGFDGTFAQGQTRNRS